MSPFKSSITKNLGKFLEVFESRNIGSANLEDADKEWGDPSAAGGSVYFDSPGSGSWTVPPGITAARFTIIGGGGSGGQYSGGGGGGAALKYMPVTAGDVIGFTLGAGGARQNGAGQPGGTSTLSYNGVTISASGGNGGTNTDTTSNPSFGGVNGGSGNGGDINGVGGNGYGSAAQLMPTFGYTQGAAACGYDGGAGGGGMGSDNSDAGAGGLGSGFAGGGGGGGADNGSGGMGGNGGELKIEGHPLLPDLSVKSGSFGGGGGGSDGTNTYGHGGAGGGYGGEEGEGYGHPYPGVNSQPALRGGFGGGPPANRGDKGVGNGQNAGGGGGAAAGGGGGAAGHWDPSMVAGGGGGGMLIIEWGPTVGAYYDLPEWDWSYDTEQIWTNTSHNGNQQATGITGFLNGTRVTKFELYFDTYQTSSDVSANANEWVIGSNGYNAPGGFLVGYYDSSVTSGINIAGEHMGGYGLDTQYGHAVGQWVGTKIVFNGCNSGSHGASNADTGGLSVYTRNQAAPNSTSTNYGSGTRWIHRGTSKHNQEWCDLSYINMGASSSTANGTRTNAFQGRMKNVRIKITA